MAYIKNYVLILLIVSLLSILGSCGSTNLIDFKTDSNSTSVRNKTTTEISLPIEKFRTLNPILSKDEDVYFLEKLVYDSLIDLDSVLAPIPSLAKNWSYSDAGLTLTFNIKTDVFWQDKVKLTANDVKFTIDAFMKAQYATPSLYSPMIANIKSVAANGTDQIVIRFKDNSNNAVEQFVFPILPSHLYNSINELIEQEKSFMPVGTGPYKISSIDEIQKIILIPNDLYQGEKKAQNKLIFKIVPDKVQAVNLFDIGDLMVTYSKSIDRDTIYSDKEVNIYPFTSNEVEVLGFNTSNPIFVDKRVRQAIAYAIDTKEIIDGAYFGNGVRNGNIYFPNYLGIDSSDNLINFNIQKAIALLAEAGYVNRDGDNYLEDASGKEITINILVNSEDKARVAAAGIIKNSLDKLPLHSYIMLKDWSGYTNALNSGSFEVFIGGWRVSEIYDMRFAIHSGYNNPVRYKNAEMDLLLDRLQSGVPAQEKLDTFIRIKEILNDELPYYCLTYKTYAAVTSKSMKGVFNPYFHDIYHESEEWKYIN
jgi:peptide/nickel transport system substrate-binding protein